MDLSLPLRDWCPEALASGMVGCWHAAFRVTVTVDWPATRKRRESRDGLRVTEAETLEGPENPGKWQPATCHWQLERLARVMNCSNAMQQPEVQAASSLKCRQQAA
jgi:hypothetical protein